MYSLASLRYIMRVGKSLDVIFRISRWMMNGSIWRFPSSRALNTLSGTTFFEILSVILNKINWSMLAPRNHWNPQEL